MRAILTVECVRWSPHCGCVAGLQAGIRAMDIIHAVDNQRMGCVVPDSWVKPATLNTHEKSTVHIVRRMLCPQLVGGYMARRKEEFPIADAPDAVPEEDLSKTITITYTKEQLKKYKRTLGAVYAGTKAKKLTEMPWVKEIKEQKKGVLADEVDAAGNKLEVGDMIMAIGDKPVYTVVDAERKFRQGSRLKKTQTKMTITVVRTLVKLQKGDVILTVRQQRHEGSCLAQWLPLCSHMCKLAPPLRLRRVHAYSPVILTVACDDTSLCVVLQVNGEGAKGAPMTQRSMMVETGLIVLSIMRQGLIYHTWFFKPVVSTFADKMKKVQRGLYRSYTDRPHAAPLPNCSPHCIT